MRSLAPAVLILSLAMLLTGCVQGGLPSTCSNVTPDRLANCVYIWAVTEQNAFDCYSISDLGQRKMCISDASNPAIKKKLGGMAQSERDSIFVSKPFPSAPSTSIMQPLPSNATEDTGAVLDGNETIVENATSLDQRVYEQAVQANDVQLCEQIADYSVLRSCISQIARQKKIPAICDTLSDKDNIELCRMYSQGGDVKG
jgi:hypothetical protein